MASTMTELTRSAIHQGDCVQLLNQLTPESVDLVFADPPFNIGYDYDVYDDARQTDDYLQWCRQWIDGVYRSLKPDGTFWLAIGDEYAAELKIESQKAGFHCRSWVIWYYTFGVNCKNGFSRSHTHLFHFVKDPENFTFNRSNPQVRVPSARQLVYADNRANPNGRLPDNTWITRPQDAPESFSPNHDTWYFARVAGTFKEREGFHGCQMPEQLLGRIVRCSSKPGDLVVDPFGGSGTTLCVAKKLGRQFMGFELSEEYAAYIQQRLEKTCVGDSLDGPVDPIKSAPSTAKGKKKKKPKVDRATERAVIDAFQYATNGQSTDFLLCDVEMSKAFVAECRSQKIDGNPEFWHKLLLRMRKSKRLPKATATTRRMSFAEMDGYSFGSEIAWRMLSVDYGKTLDDILCCKEFAAEFDRIAAEFAPGFSLFEYRWAALALRKRSKSSRTLAEESFGKWKKKKLPAAVELSACLNSEFEQPGIYIVRSESDDLYIGETENIRSRIQTVMDNAAWQNLQPETAVVIPCDESKRNGLQAALAMRLRPLLNLSH